MNNVSSQSGKHDKHNQMQCQSMIGCFVELLAKLMLVFQNHGPVLLFVNFLHNHTAGFQRGLNCLQEIIKILVDGLVEL